MPARRTPRTRSLGLKRSARRMTKIGTVAFAIAAMPESMYCSPQAMSVNGKRGVEEPDARRRVRPSPASRRPPAARPPAT